MKINSTTQGLVLVLESLKSIIAPELTTKNAKSILGAIEATLLDLLKRQGPSAVILKQIVDAGQQLEHEMLLLQEPETTFTEESGSPTQTFDELALYHEQLTARLSRLGTTLSSERPSDPQVSALLRRAAEWEHSYYSGIQEKKAEISPVKAENPAISQDFMKSFLTEMHGAVEVTRFERVPGGHGKQAYLCQVRYANGGEEKLVVRKSDGAPIVLDRAFLVEQEYSLLKCLKDTDIPAPEVYDLWLKPSGPSQVDSSFFTMKFIEGSAPANYLKMNDGKVSETILLQLAEILAKLHSVPLETFGAHIQQFEGASYLGETTAERYRRVIDEWYQYTQRVEHLPSPYLAWLFNWLRQNVPDDARPPVLTHGDFNIHNILVRNDTVTGILDWECADFGCPEQDLAYIHPVVSQHMAWDKFLDRYLASGGKDINQSYFGFCQAFSVLRTTLAFNRATTNLQRRSVADIRLSMVELGYQASFMGMALEYTADLPNKRPVVNGHSLTNGNANTSSSREKYIERQDSTLTTPDGQKLTVYGDHANRRQKPGPQDIWQESIVLVWWDDASRVGGFHRLGHEPNRKDGPKATLWNHLITPAGFYKRQRFQDLRSEDTPPDLSFGCGDDTCTHKFVDGEHIWDISDGDVSAHLSFTDTGPNVACFPTSKTFTEGFASLHFDIPGQVRGWVNVKGRKFPVEAGFGIRDHAWGPRDWNQTLQGHRWVVGSAGKELGFVGVGFQKPDCSVAQFGWVVRDGVVTMAKELDIVAYMEADSQVNRGGAVKYRLTTGEELHFTHTPVGVPAAVSHHHGLNCVDRICKFECSNGLQGFSCFETSCNVRRESARPATFTDGIADDGLHSFKMLN
ncbi:kinase-like domain-containing protein [Paraphoma chrysanthemicola]|uniref:Kinase-like domain-containing protein n=1 Tax=Paraphoma chrysanthemicola TaxID=798071 RepID=A0A8K0R650_9PLEO|nr:kinase-like domain-containing protein [Paraphoma chrysanthemicola]